MRLSCNHVTMIVFRALKLIMSHLSGHMVNRILELWAFHMKFNEPAKITINQDPLTRSRLIFLAYFNV